MPCQEDAQTAVHSLQIQTALVPAAAKMLPRK